MVPASELARIQSDAVAMVCDKTCTIWRETALVSDGMGTETPTYTQIESTVAGMTQPSAGELANYDYLIGDKSAWTVRLPIGTDVTHQDQLHIEGQVLEVHVLLNPRSYEIFHSVIAVEIK